MLITFYTLRGPGFDISRSNFVYKILFNIFYGHLRSFQNIAGP